MAKTTTVTGKVDIVDLIRDRKLCPHLAVPPCRVIVTFDVITSALLTTPKPAPSSKIDRMKKAAEATLDEYENIITKECKRFNKQIDDLIKAGKQKEADQVVSAVNGSVRNALASVEGAARKAVADAMKKEAQGDKLLTEARLKTAVKVTFDGISLATNITTLASSSGADVTAYFSIAKTLFDLGSELKQQLKDEPKLRADLRKGLDAYIALRGTAVMEAARFHGLTNTSGFPGFPEVFHFIGEAIGKTGKELTGGKDAAQIAREVLQFTVKGVSSAFQNVETAREMYRNHTAKMRHEVDDISAQADRLAAVMKRAATLKQGVQAGAECMKVKARVRVLAGQLDDAVSFLTAMETAMKGAGLACDDRTILEKIEAIDKATIATEGSGLVENIYSIYSLVAALKSAVGM